jgi:hypothetical protein
VTASIGAIDGSPPATVDDRGVVELPTGTIVGWHVRGVARGHDPRAERSLYQAVDRGVVETTVRTGDGDVTHRAYGLGAGTHAVEIENRSGAAVAAAILLSDAAALPTLRAPRPPVRSCRAPDIAGLYERLAADLTDPGPGDARDGAVGQVWPVAPHGSLLVAFGGTAGRSPGADAVRRSWSAHLRRGMQFETDDPAVVAAVDRARVDILVRSGVADAATIRALEDWGFDAEAVSAWARASGSERRRARRRGGADPATAWSRARDALGAGAAAVALNALREVVALDQPGGVDLFPGFPAEWRGRAVTVHAVPVRDALVSAALRWHGERPALLWESSSRLTVRCSALDARFTATGCAGDALLDVG